MCWQTLFDGPTVYVITHWTGQSKIAHFHNCLVTILKQHVLTCQEKSEKRLVQASESIQLARLYAFNMNKLFTLDMLSLLQC